jgi:transcriptional regulator with XRE-family HTH domain
MSDYDSETTTGKTDMVAKRPTETGLVIGRRVHALRMDSGLGLTESAKAMDLSHQKMSEIEAGKTIPDLVTAGIICAFYDAPVDFLLTGTGLTRQLTLPEFTATVLKSIMTPIDLVAPREASSRTKAGILHLPNLPIPIFDLQRQMVRGRVYMPPPRERYMPTVKTLTAADLKGAGLMHLPKVKKSRRKPVVNKPDVSSLAGFDSF